MISKNMKIEFSSALIDVVEKNPSFDMGKLRIAYTGKNRNNTFISKESFERAIPTMFNCPVVANYKRKQDEIGSHDGEFIKGKDGETKYVNVTQPVGLVPESAQWSWETVEDKGVMHQYLCTEVVLWKRQEAYEKIKSNGITKQSMEIEVTNGEMLDDYYDIKDFCFTAFCLLGTAEPCFESAALFTFAEQEEFKEQYTEMLKEFKLAFASASDEIKKEGNENLKLKDLLEKYSVTEESLPFEVDGLTDEELEEKFIDEYEKTDEKTDDEPEADDEPDDTDTEPEADEPEESEEGSECTAEPDDEADTDDDGAGESEDFELNSQIASTLREAVRCAEDLECEWGSCPRYWMVDYDESVSEVYFYDEEDGKLYGCPYTFDGDDVVLDFEQCKRKKYSIVDYIEGSEQELEVFEVIKSFDERYAELKINADEFKRLKEFEAGTLQKKREADEKALFDKFEDKLKDNEDFEALKENAASYELDALEKELFALVGKVDFTFSVKKMSKGNQGKPIFGFESAAKAASDSMDEFMGRLLKKED